MKQKKTMRLWQMIIILLLSVTMIITMFSPAFRVDSKARRKQIDVINKDEELLGQLEKNYNSQDGSSLFNIPVKYDYKKGFVDVPLWDADFLRHRSSGWILDFRYLQTITVYDDFIALCRELEAFENTKDIC